MSAYALAELAGVHRSTILRFLSEECGLTGDSWDKVGAALRLRLVEVGTAKAKKKVGSSDVN